MAQQAGGSPAGSPSGSQVPVPGAEEYDPELFEPIVPPEVGAASAGQRPVTPGTSSGATEVQQLLMAMLQNQTVAMQQQQTQMQQLLEAQQAHLRLMERRLDAEDERRKQEETAKAATPNPFGAPTATSSSTAPSGAPVAPSSGVASGSQSFTSRAEKYLPPLPVINGQEMSKGRIRELEEWHRFLEVLSSWLALTDDAYVSELRECLFVKTEIQQVTLPRDTAGRSARLFYLLQQALGKWDRGMEVLRSVSMRQGNAAAGYESVRELYRQYSVNSRMEAVYIRDELLKLHLRCVSMKRPLDVVRYLEDEFSKGDAKLLQFADLKISAGDRAAVLLQAVSQQAREYLVLHGRTSSWSEMTDSLRFYEEQLRMVGFPNSGQVRG